MTASCHWSRTHSLRKTEALRWRVPGKTNQNVSYVLLRRSSPFQQMQRAMQWNACLSLAQIQTLFHYVSGMSEKRRTVLQPQNCSLGNARIRALCERCRASRGRIIQGARRRREANTRSPFSSRVQQTTSREWGVLGETAHGWSRKELRLITSVMTGRLRAGWISSSVQMTRHYTAAGVAVGNSHQEVSGFRKVCVSPRQVPSSVGKEVVIVE